MNRRPIAPLPLDMMGECSAHLSDMIDGHDGGRLYVPGHDGKAKFFVKVEPSVYLIGATRIELGDPDFPGFTAFFADEGLPEPPPELYEEGKDAGTLAELAGRLCYYSFKKPRPGGHVAFMNRIIQEGHGSVIEHAHFNFLITGVSRTFSHELVRHRLASYSQLSQRYFNETECSFICPPKTARNPVLFSRWLATMETCYDNYVEQIIDMEASTDFDDHRDEKDHQETVRRKAILGEARSQLPNAIETKLVFSCNARCLRGVLDQRSYPGADQEIRRVAAKLYDLAYGKFPTGFEDYERIEHPVFGRYVTTPHKKI